jgi:hypothetical protein
MVINNGLERIQKEAVVAYCKVTSCNLLGETRIILGLAAYRAPSEEKNL